MLEEVQELVFLQGWELWYGQQDVPKCKYHVKVINIWSDGCLVQNPLEANWLDCFLIDYHHSKMRSQSVVSLKEWSGLVSSIGKGDHIYGDLGCT